MLPACAAVALIRGVLRVMSGLLVLLLGLARLILYALVPTGRCIYNILIDLNRQHNWLVVLFQIEWAIGLFDIVL